MNLRIMNLRILTKLTKLKDINQIKTSFYRSFMMYWIQPNLRNMNIKIKIQSTNYYYVGELRQISLS